jgi:hypothetical protein
MTYLVYKRYINIINPMCDFVNQLAKNSPRHSLYFASAGDCFWAGD